MFNGVSMFFVILLLALLTPVSASLYPTQPIQNTVYYAGQTALTNWTDDGTYPLLNNMGGITIQLYCDSDVRSSFLGDTTRGDLTFCADVPRDARYEREPWSQVLSLRYTQESCAAAWWLEFVCMID